MPHRTTTAAQHKNNMHVQPLQAQGDLSLTWHRLLVAAPANKHHTTSHHQRPLQQPHVHRQPCKSRTCLLLAPARSALAEQFFSLPLLTPQYKYSSTNTPAQSLTPSCTVLPAPRAVAPYRACTAAHKQHGTQQPVCGTRLTRISPRKQYRQHAPELAKRVHSDCLAEQHLLAAQVTPNAQS